MPKPPMRAVQDQTPNPRSLLAHAYKEGACPPAGSGQKCARRRRRITTLVATSLSSELRNPEPHTKKIEYGQAENLAKNLRAERWVLPQVVLLGGAMLCKSPNPVRTMSLSGSTITDRDFYRAWAVLSASDVKSITEFLWRDEKRWDKEKQKLVDVIPEFAPYAPAFHTLWVALVVQT